MPYEIALSATAANDLRSLRPFDRAKVAHQIDAQLQSQPLVETRNRKPLRMEEGLLPFEHVPPVWELRVGGLRVYYDVEKDAGVVNVRAVRRKPPHRSTKESRK